jgi:Family of unknown function (DUF6010)
MHAAWDLVRHLWGKPIWPYMRTSSYGCMIFDSLIAIWFLAGAPSIFHWRVGASLESTVPANGSERGL